MTTENQLAAMKIRLKEVGQSISASRILGNSSGRKLPAIEKFEIDNEGLNLLLESIGIRKIKNRKIDVTLTREKRLNRYMEHQIIRIRKYKEKNPKLSGIIAESCIKRSLTFRMSAFQHIFPTGYYEMALSKVWEINRKVEKILSSNDDNLEFKRVYIPKANGKFRPLGVPTPAGRVVTHMWNNMIVEIMKDELLKEQHAYIPGKGTMTAGRSIIERCRHYKFIYETDLKSFFDNVDRSKIFDLLEKKDIPKRIYYWLDNLCMNTPKLQGEDLCDEGPVRRRISFQSGDISSVVDKMIGGPDSPFRENPDLLFQFMKEDGCETIEEYAQLQGALLDQHGLGDMYEERSKGVPQGLPISPFLSILGLKDYLSQQESVNYADDQVFFGNHPFEIKDDPEKGIFHNEDKCGGVKYDGRGTERGLKFLGFRLKDGINFSSETRKNVREEIHFELKNIFGYPESYVPKTLEKDYNDLMFSYQKLKDYDSDTGLEKLSRKKFFGFVMNCMSIGDGDNDTLLEKTRKGMRETLAKLNKKALIKKAPSRYQSTTSLIYLADCIQTISRKR